MTVAHYRVPSPYAGQDTRRPSPLRPTTVALLALAACAPPIVSAPVVPVVIVVDEPRPVPTPAATRASAPCSEGYGASERELLRDELAAFPLNDAGSDP